MVYFFYHFAWTLLFIFSLPLTLSHKGRRFIHRFGRGLPSGIQRRKRIWIHALSTGEVISASPLVDQIRKFYPSEKIVLTVKTSQGMAVAREGIGKKVDLLMPMPFDFWCSLGRLIRFIRPSLLILVESDIWPGLISYLYKRDIKIILINGRVSPRTLKSYKRLDFLARMMFNKISLCLMQSELDTRRLAEIGIQSSRIKTVGNIKFDRPLSSLTGREKEILLDRMKLSKKNKVWVAGSTHEGEEEIVLECFGLLRSDFHDLRLIIAPRRIERTKEICQLCVEKGFNPLRMTDTGTEGKDFHDVLLLNTLGELGRIYGIADVSFVGGSLVPIGGHNLLEPAIYGCPVVFGIHTHNFVLMSQLLLESGGGKRVKDGKDLFIAVKRLLLDPEEAILMGSKAKAFVEQNKGALKRVMDYIGEYIDAR